MDRSLYTDDHEQFRESVKTFIAREITPDYLGVGSGGHRPTIAVPSSGQPRIAWDADP
jgi:hypothetical protein